MRTARNHRSTPKVFHSTYRPPRQFSWEPYRSLWPLVLVLILVVAGLFVTRSRVFQIQHLQLTGVELPEVISRLDRLKGTFILSPTVARETALIAQTVAELDMLDCQRGLPSTLRCQATSREPMFIWQKAGEQWLLDQTGRLYAVKDPTAASSVPILEDRALQPVKLGQDVASSEVLKQLHELHQALTVQERLGVERLFLQESYYQVGAIINARPDRPFPAQPISVFFTTTAPLKNQLQSLNTLLDQKSAQITERIDLRVAGYAYFK